MKPKPYTDEEIVEKLADGRLAATDLEAAMRLAMNHSEVIIEYGNQKYSPIRITIPRPPKRVDVGGRGEYFSNVPQEPLVITTEGGE